MEEKENIKIAFFLNLGFSIFEFIGGMLTNSVAIFSDAIHDLGDSLAIGISYGLEVFSKRKPDKKYTYGYKRYSLLGAFLTSFILLFGSLFVFIYAIRRIFQPTEVNFVGMLIFSIFGMAVNGYAAYKTSRSVNLNERSVNLHMLEDVLGWIAVFVGSLLIKLTGLQVIDPILSIIISIFIGIKAIKNVLEVVDVIMEKTPKNMDIDQLVQEVKGIHQVLDVHHVHLWSLDGNEAFLTMHVFIDKNVTKKNYESLKEEVKHILLEKGITHSTIEFEYEDCGNQVCEIK